MSEEQAIAPAHSKRTFLQLLYTNGFLVTVATALITYINSTFLESIVPKAYVGVVFAAAYGLTIFAMEYYGPLITKFGNLRVMMGTFIIHFIVTLLLAFNLHSVISIVAFLIFVVCINVTAINYDILLEMISANTETGRIRGAFLTVLNLGFVVSPIITGQIVQKWGFNMVYLVSALVLLPAIFLLLGLKDGKKVKFKAHGSLVTVWRKTWEDKNLRGIFGTAFMLYFFYSWMIIYTPIYLLEHGFTWNEIGIIFTVMLIPFVLFEFPAGYIADRYLGEKELLIFGLVLMALAVLLFVFMDSFLGFMIVLFLSRCGASLVEVMRDTYFYKIVDAEDIDLIDRFRSVGPVAYMMAPVMASVLLAVGLQLFHLYILLGVIIILGTLFPMMITDTK